MTPGLSQKDCLGGRGSDWLTRCHHPPAKNWGTTQSGCQWRMDMPSKHYYYCNYYYYYPASYILQYLSTEKLQVWRRNAARTQYASAKEENAKSAANRAAFRLSTRLSTTDTASSYNFFTPSLYCPHNWNKTEIKIKRNWNKTVSKLFCFSRTKTPGHETFLAVLANHCRYKLRCLSAKAEAGGRDMTYAWRRRSHCSAG